jgi:valyl-tRNA synthetase
MELAKSFEPSAIENRWYDFWESSGYFTTQSNAAQSNTAQSNTVPAGAGDGADTGSYCIQLPPPNVTGTLHMGHAFQQTLMDALIRYHRMRGLETNWVVGTDHPRRNRNTACRRAPARGRRQNATRPRARSLRRAGLALEAAVRRDDHAPDAPARFLR